MAYGGPSEWFDALRGSFGPCFYLLFFENEGRRGWLTISAGACRGLRHGLTVLGDHGANRRVIRPAGLLALRRECRGVDPLGRGRIIGLSRACDGRRRAIVFSRVAVVNRSAISPIPSNSYFHPTVRCFPNYGYALERQGRWSVLRFLDVELPCSE